MRLTASARKTATAARAQAAVTGNASWAPTTAAPAPGLRPPQSLLITSASTTPLYCHRASSTPAPTTPHCKETCAMRRTASARATATATRSRAAVSGNASWAPTTAAPAEKKETCRIALTAARKTATAERAQAAVTGNAHCRVQVHPAPAPGLRPPRSLLNRSSVARPRARKGASAVLSAMAQLIAILPGTTIATPVTKIRQMPPVPLVAFAAAMCENGSRNVPSR